MLVTEEDARKGRLCVFIRKDFPDFNRDPVCVASICMMWRWAGGDEDKRQGLRLGYCGLAGRPE